MSERSGFLCPLFFVDMKEIIEKIKDLVSNLLQDKKIELVDIIYRRESGGMVLRLLVDKTGGVTLDDCSTLNQEIGNILDSGDIMPDRYLLEISSPGLDRHLKTKGDFERVMGQKINVHTYEPINDKRDYSGEVLGVDEENVTVGGVKIPFKKIAKAKLDIKV